MRKTLLVLAVGAFAVAVLALSGAWVVDRTWGREAVPMGGDFDPAPDEVALATAEGIEVYGTPLSKEPLRFLVFDESRLFRPPGMDAVVLLEPAPEGSYDYQAVSLWFPARQLAAGAALTGVVLLLVRRLLARKGCSCATAA